MLAFSVREALREAAAAFGPPGTSVDLASPATPEQVWWAIEQARAGGRRPAEGAPGVEPEQPDAGPAAAAAAVGARRCHDESRRGRGGLRCTGPRPSPGCDASGSPGCW